MSPDGKTNLAVKDVMNAISFIKMVASSFGGSPAITLAGQSSGANMIRALLAAPSASSLFKSGILHSDPMVIIFHQLFTRLLIQSRRITDSCLLPLNDYSKVNIILLSIALLPIQVVGIL